jgi:single-stranded-DNA-specific exonuclease
MVTAEKLDERDAIVVAKEGWHPGVVGIVAGRLASAFGRPVIVGAMEGETVTASVRSGNGVPVVTALGKCRDVVKGFGGHEKAAGVTFASDRLRDLQDAFSDACRDLASATPERASIRADVRLDEGDEPYDVLRDFTLLEPCGEANRAPSLGVAARIRTAKEVKGGHLKLELDVGRKILSGFGAGLGSLAKELSGDVNVVGSLRRDSWRGGIAVEVRVDGIEKV